MICFHRAEKIIPPAAIVDILFSDTVPLILTMDRNYYVFLYPVSVFVCPGILSERKAEERENP